jgi:acetaldehyde dehydrogenase (acetylating)
MRDDRGRSSGRKLRGSILGSGNIGSDLLVKIMRSELLECTLFVGRNSASRGLAKAAGEGVRICDRGIDAIVEDPDCCDIVFDATSALSHAHHWEVLRSLGKKVIDLTPSNVGEMCIPAVNLKDCLGIDNVNMVTCGGQATIPIAHVISEVHPVVTYVEVVSMIASRSAGPATRLNLDEYIRTTERGLLKFTNAHRAKAILNLNPALPSVDMQATVFALVDEPDLAALEPAIDAIVASIKRYVPGYELIVPPTIENGRVVVMVRVRGRGDYLPPYAGNLDIINCAALAMAEAYASRERASQ